MNSRSWLIAELAAVALLAAGCGSDSSSASPGGEGEELTVAAAASLADAFPAYAESTSPEERFSFAGSDELAAQIRQGAPVDVYAAANSDLPQMLFEEGQVSEPAAFATNSLVVAVPEDSGIDSVEDLSAPGLDLVIGTEDVPFGSYTRTVLDRLPADEREAIVANVRSEESDVKAAVGKLTQGAADASFIYASDVSATPDRVRAIRLPTKLQPGVVYAVAVVDGTEHPEAAREFVDGLSSSAGLEALEAAGFAPPPDG